MIGARITNPAKGTVVIDQNYSNLCLRSFERFQINGSGQYATIQKAFTSTVGVVAFAEGNVFVGNISRSGSTCTYTLTAVPGTWVKAYVFDVSQYGQRYYDNPLGVRIRNPISGQIMFDSRIKYLKLVDFIQGEGTAGHSLNRQYPGRNIAAIQGLAFATWFVAGVSGGGPVFDVNVWASMRANGNSFVTTQEQTQVNAAPPTVGPTSATQPHWNYLIIDVTDF